MKVSRRIATQIVGGILPVFVGLATLGLVLNYYLAARELTRNQQTEAGALAVTIANFIRADDWAKIAAGRPAATELPAALERIARWQILRQLTLRDARDGRIVFAYPASASPPDAPPLASVLAELAREPLLVSLPGRGNNSAPMLAYAPIRGPAGEIAAVVTVAPDRARYDQARRDLLWRRLGQSGGVALFGLGVSLALALFLSREIRALAASIRHIGTPAFAEAHRTVIQEVDELGNTFSVLHHVLDEVRARTRRTLVDAEMFRTEADLARVFAAESPTAWQLTLGAVELYAVGTGWNAASGFVRAACAPAGGGVAFFGRVAETDPLAAVLQGSAAGSYLLRAAETQPLAALLPAAVERFSLPEIQAVSWTADDQCMAWIYDPALRTAPPGPAARLTADRALLFSLLGPTNRARADLIGRRFAARAPAELAAVLAGTLDPAEPGLILIMRLANPPTTA
jgi:hypothetical protein